MVHLLKKMKYSDSMIFVIWIFAAFVRILYIRKNSFLKRNCRVQNGVILFPRIFFHICFFFW